ncbi:YraN family protein [Spongiibacter sp. KMU-158]|uniref:UPF0102 protein IB286_12010 n=1 Tax=Spongiibacter pelagi TaxID=2760804 RepID=A0A927GX29_9GAMM|nr:YraN family protein [Spongiibacter pelagi]MBD2859728.1 YraN family protein [Spongiibacter pelagi]
MKKSGEHLQIGNNAEQAAAALLSDNGYKIVTRNYRCRFGEIDIIALSGSHLVFIEVRHRRPSTFGTGAESVTPSKQRRIIATAKHYLSKGKFSTLPCRFDIISSSPTDNGMLELQWLKNAFQLN